MIPHYCHSDWSVSLISAPVALTAPGSLGVEFTITRERDVRTPVPGAHICFRASSRSAVQAFHTAALLAGGRDDGAPGLRPQYHADYYAAFVLDPDGHRHRGCLSCAERTAGARRRMMSRRSSRSACRRRSYSPRRRRRRKTNVLDSDDPLSNRPGPHAHNSVR